MPRKSRGPYLKWREEKGSWYIYHYERGRERCQSASTADRSEAEKQLSSFILSSRKAEGTHFPHERLIADALSDYAEEKGKHLKSQKTFLTCLDRLNEFWGEDTVSRVTESRCREYHEFRNRQFRDRPKGKWLYKDQNKRDISPSIVARELSVLSASLNHDAKKGRLLGVPAVWLPKFDNRKDRWLTRSEAARLLWASRAKPKSRLYLPLFILLGLYTGQRHTAILQLKWSQIDLERKLINFNNPKQELTKKGRSLQKMPVRLWSILKRRKSKTGHVIQFDGHPIKSVKKAFGEACREAGLEGVSPHTLRHSNASWQAQRGVSFAKIARFIGHADSRTTERIYAHHAPDYLDESADALDHRVARPETRPEKQNTTRKIKKKPKKTG